MTGPILTGLRGTKITGSISYTLVTCPLPSLIFIGYPPGQQGYKCWNPTERRTFVSMDVTFRESEPFYGEQKDLSMLFDGLDHLSQLNDGQEGRLQ
jgi:hypothetical protein